MKKLIKTIKFIHSFTNHTVSVQDEADSLYNCMAYKSDPLRTIEVFKALETRIELEMRLEEKRCSNVCGVINSKWQKEPEYLELKVIDPIFEKPIKK